MQPTNVVTGLWFYGKMLYRMAREALVIFLVLSIVVAVMEVFSMSMIAPVLAAVGGGEDTTGLSVKLEQLFNFLGINYELGSLMVLFLVIFTIKFGIEMFAVAYRLRIKTTLEKELRVQMTKAIAAMSYEEFLMRENGYYTNLLSREISLTTAAVDKYTQVVAFTAFTIAYCCGAMLVDPVVAGLVLLLGGATFPALRRASVKRQKVSKAVSKENANMQSGAIEFLANYKYLKATGVVWRFMQRLIDNYERQRYLVFWNQFGAEGIACTLRWIVICGVLVFLWVKVGIMGGSIAEVAVLGFFFYRAMQYFLGIQERWQAFLVQTGAINQVDEGQRMLDEHREPVRTSPPVDFEDEIVLEHVQLELKGNLVLDDVSLRIPKRAVVGFAGPSGAGKSSLVNVITGLLPANGGKVTIDGKDYAELDLRELRTLFGYVCQEPVAFNGTIFENVSNWEDSEDEKVMDAVQQANLGEFVKGSQQGLLTEIGGSGSRISGGQRQRIAIARELYRNPPILVFDEATSSLDSESEDVIQRTLESIKGDRTILVVSHRLSSLRFCDTIYVLKAGKVVEEGGWDDLVGRDGSVFKELCRLQGVV